MTNKQKFQEELEKQYEVLFATDKDYAYAASTSTPKELAEKMTGGLIRGSASKDGDGIKRTCKKLGIKHTYKGILEFLCN